MTKAKKIIYWIATLWLALGMTSTGIVQIMHLKEEAEKIIHLGYPLYFLSLIGVWKILGVIAILIPKFPLIKEWAYAGFFFTMTGAAFSHITVHNPITEIAPSLLLLTLTLVSWYYRPVDRKLTSIN
ncbi:DoxX family protein [Pedobacter sp. PWIIR3]